MKSGNRRKRGVLGLTAFKTIGVVVDLRLPELDRDTLAEALGPWSMVLAIAEAIGHRYVIAAGRIGATNGVQATAADEAAVEQAVQIAHARIGDSYYADGGATPWLLLVDPT